MPTRLPFLPPHGNTLPSGTRWTRTFWDQVLDGQVWSLTPEEYRSIGSFRSAVSKASRARGLRAITRFHGPRLAVQAVRAAGHLTEPVTAAQERW